MTAAAAAVVVDAAFLQASSILMTRKQPHFISESDWCYLTVT
jgi:hypothetical protein